MVKMCGRGIPETPQILAHAHSSTLRWPDEPTGSSRASAEVRALVVTHSTIEFPMPRCDGSNGPPERCIDLRVLSSRAATTCGVAQPPLAYGPGSEADGTV